MCDCYLRQKPIYFLSRDKLSSPSWASSPVWMAFMWMPITCLAKVYHREKNECKILTKTWVYCNLTISRRSLCSSLTMKMVSKRDKMVGIKSIFSSPLLSSQRPNTELAAANTAHRELSVVVIPAWKKSKLEGTVNNESLDKTIP